MTLHPIGPLWEAHQRFVDRVVASEVVWGLRGPRGFAASPSNDEDCDVIMFWSDRGYASRVKQRHFADHELAEITLFDFLFRWMPGMVRDGALAGTNWNGDLAGMEIDPDDLQTQLMETLGADRAAAYLARLRNATEDD